MNLQQLFPQLDLSRIGDPGYLSQFAHPDPAMGGYQLRGADGELYDLNSTLSNEQGGLGQMLGLQNGSINVTHHYGTGDAGGGQYYEFGADGNLLAGRNYKNYAHNVRDAVGMSAMVLGGVAGVMGAGGAMAGAGAGGAEAAGPGMAGWGMDLGTSMGTGLSAGEMGAAGVGAAGAAGGPGSAGWGMDLGGAGGIDGAAQGYSGAGLAGGAGGGPAGGTSGAVGGGTATPSGFSMEGTLKALAPQLVSGGASLIGGALNAGAAKDAAGIQAGAAQSGIDETRRQFDTMTGLLQPYIDAGKRGLTGYEGLAGTMGAPAQAQAITDLQGTPMYGSTVKAGEDAILQNVAATGGLRGGNVQDALAKFRAGQLTNLVDQQLSRYGNLATLGQNSAARVGAGGMSAADSISKLLQQQGSANAGGVLAGNNAIVNTIGGLGGLYAANGSSLPSMSTSGMQAGLAQTSMGSSGFGSGMAYGNQDLGGYF